jgi:hypothetical protein
MLFRIYCYVGTVLNYSEFNNLSDALIAFDKLATQYEFPAEFRNLRNHPDYARFMRYELDALIAGDLDDVLGCIALQRVPTTQTS